MIVDDNATFRHAARMLLETSGYDVVAQASCGAGALEAVGRHAPNAVLLDVCLGADDGFEVCDRLLRARPELAVVLASAADQDRERIERSGARGFLNKSRLFRFDFGELWPQG